VIRVDEDARHLPFARTRITYLIADRPPGPFTV
jgi:hypothetical protein